MSEDWIISQLLVNSKTRKRLLDFEEVEYIKNGKTLTDLPLDLLAFVLSYCPLNSVLSCMLINKKCYEAITTRKHFWNRYIQEKLKNYLDPKYIGLYDTFFIKQSFRDQYEWLFRLTWCNSAKENFYYLFRRRNLNYMVYEIVIDNETSKLHGIQYYNSKTFRWQEDTCEFYSFDTEKSRFVKYMKMKHGKPVNGELVFKDGSSWIGELNDKHVPHGKGVWKYKDLTIATEAVNGKPIFNMTIEEYYLFQEDNLRVRFEGLI